MKIKKISIIAIVILMLMPVFMPITVNAASTYSLPNSAQGEQTVDINTITFNYNESKKIYLPENYTDYFVLQNVSNQGTYKYAITYYSLPETATSGQIQYYSNNWCFELMLSLSFESLENAVKFLNNPDNTSTVKKCFISATYPDKTIKIPTNTSNIVYSSSEYVIKQEYYGGGTTEYGYQTKIMAEQYWTTIYENPYIPPCLHTNTVTQGTSEATTTTHGYTGDTICLDCGEITKYGEFIHKFNSNNVCYICGVVKNNIGIGSNVINNKTYYYPAGYPTLTVIFGYYNDLIIWSPENTKLKVQSNQETWKVHYINEDGTASDSTTDYYYIIIDKNYSEYNFDYEYIVNTITNIETEYTKQESFYGYYYRAIVGDTFNTRSGYNGHFEAITIEELFGEHAEHIEDTPEVIPEPEEPEITPPTEDEEGGIIGLLKTILEYLNPFNWIKASNGTLFFDKAGELINESLKDNKFYTKKGSN